MSKSNRQGPMSAKLYDKISLSFPAIGSDEIWAAMAKLTEMGISTEEHDRRLGTHLAPIIRWLENALSN